jgi:hypothetical protein
MLIEFVAWLGLAERLAAVRTIAPTGDRIARDPEGRAGRTRRGLHGLCRG